MTDKKQECAVDVNRAEMVSRCSFDLLKHIKRLTVPDHYR